MNVLSVRTVWLLISPQSAQLPGSLCLSSVPQQGRILLSMSTLQARQRADLDHVLIVHLPFKQTSSVKYSIYLWHKEQMTTPTPPAVNSLCSRFLLNRKLRQLSFDLLRNCFNCIPLRRGLSSRANELLDSSPQDSVIKGSIQATPAKGLLATRAAQGTCHRRNKMRGRLF